MLVAETRRSIPVDGGQHEVSARGTTLDGIDWRQGIAVVASRSPVGRGIHETADDGRANAEVVELAIGPSPAGGSTLLGTPATDPVESLGPGSVQAQVASPAPEVAIRTRRLPDLEISASGGAGLVKTWA